MYLFSSSFEWIKGSRVRKVRVVSCLFGLIMAFIELILLIFLLMITIRFRVMIIKIKSDLVGKHYAYDWHDLPSILIIVAVQRY